MLNVECRVVLNLEQLPHKQAENPDFKNIIVDGRQTNFAIEGQAVGLIRAEGL